ncbi:hypothetical protein RHSIM_Rhsim02G0166000 [Rhododendron simsii]|uniref:Uncharacterized protein n=1 Tax=Rhododendron simsii TaxID=118357 RepID=A0A834HBT7_RHOSS|nr:hypothetical protein RHSIM_Rhsim02G0166000 [Rhododendron simsii]
MSYLLPHLHSGWAVDQAILAEEERLVMIRFGHDWDETCMQVPSLSLYTLKWPKAQPMLQYIVALCCSDDKLIFLLSPQPHLVISALVHLAIDMP